MGLGYQFKQARRTLRNLSPADRKTLDRLCRKIRQAEEDLREAAAEALENCRTACRGICCRNVNLDAVLGFPDFVYILQMAPDLADRIAACLENEPVLYVSDCIFLENGIGPCIFPHTVMPEVCITTFCSNEPPAKMEVRQLKWRFFLLNWFLGKVKIKTLPRRFMALLAKR